MYWRKNKKNGQQYVRFSEIMKKLFLIRTPKDRSRISEDSP